MFSPGGLLATPGKPGIVLVDCGKELGKAGSSDSIRGENRHGTTVTRMRKRERRLQEAFRVVRARLVRLVDDDDIPHLEQAGLDCLDAVAKARGFDNDNRVGERGDIGTVLSGANSFDQNQRKARRVEEMYQGCGGPCETTLAAATCHASHEDTIVGVASHHAYAVPEHCPARDRTRRVDGKNRDATIRCPDAIEERSHERALSGTGWSGQAHDVSLTGERVEDVERLQPAWVFVFHQCCEAWQGPPIWRLKSKE